MKLTRQYTRQLSENMDHAIDHANIDFNPLIDKIFSNSIDKWTCKPFILGNTFRLSEHLRVVNVDLEIGYLIIKGSEPLLRDFDASLQDSFVRHCFGKPSVAEHFIWKESKIPFALTLSEAQETLNITHRIKNEFLCAYGEFPRIPIPIATYLIEDHGLLEKINSYSNNKNPWQTSQNFPETAIQISYGLAYPGRVGFFETFVGNEASSLEAKELLRLSFGSMRSWYKNIVSETAKLFSLGLVFGRVELDHLGYATKSNNVGLCGSFFDLSGSYFIDPRQSAQELASDVHVTLKYLAETVAEHICLAQGRRVYGVELSMHHLAKDILSAWPKKMIGKGLHQIIERLYGSDIFDCVRLIHENLNPETHNDNILI